MLIYIIEVSIIFIFFYFPRTKIYLFGILKNIFKSSKYVFEFIRCQIMFSNFPRIFGAFEIFFGY
jgi:hypothetical protein